MGKKSRLIESSQVQQLSPGSSFRKTRHRNEVSSLAGCFHHHHQAEGDTEIAKVHVDSAQHKGWKLLRTILKNKTMFRAIIGLVLGVGYFFFISRHFQALTNFSSLTNLEKELSLPTDTAFHYSFFKRIAKDDNSLVEGLRSVIYDSRTNWPHVVNSFHNYGLLPEVILGTIFHVVKAIRSPQCWIGPSATVQWSEQICSGLADPLTFYLFANWALDSLAIVFVMVAGATLRSTMGGLLSGLTFVLCHPQMWDWARIFPNGDGIGLMLASVNVFYVSHLVIKPIHSPWTSVVKLGLVTAAMVMAWPMESQWIFIAQLVAVLTLHFSNVLSPYFVSIVVGTHIVGFEYSSLVAVDSSMTCWTFYMYLLLGSVGVTYGLRRVIDSLFGSKLNKWLFLRAIILAVGLYVIVSEARRGILSVSSLNEDLRMSQHLCKHERNLNESKSSWPATSGGVSAALSLVMDDSNEKSLEINLIDQSTPLTALLHNPNPVGVEAFSSTREMWDSRESRGAITESYPFIDEQQPIHPEVVTSTEMEIESGENTDRIPVKVKNERDHKTQTHTDFHMNELNEYLLQCLLTSIMSPMGRLHQLFLNQFYPIGLAIVAIGFFHRELRTLDLVKASAVSNSKSMPTLASSSNEERLCRYVYYHVLCCLAFLFLSATVHEKFGILFFTQLSLLTSLFMFRVDVPYATGMREPFFEWKWNKVNLAIQPLTTSTTIAVVVMAVMMTSTKLKIDLLYESPQKFLQGDAGGKEELVQVVKWIRNQSPATSTFLGPSILMTSVYCIGERPVSNHFQAQTQLPQWKPQAPVLSQLFNPHLSHRQLCKLLNDTRISHMVISRDFCLNPAYPHVPLTLKEVKEETNTLEKADEIIGVKLNSKHHRQRQLRNGVVSDILSYPNFEPVDNPSCNLITYWNNFNKKDTNPTKRSRKVNTPCIRLLSADSELEIKPFRRVFQNRLYSVVTCS